MEKSTSQSSPNGDTKKASAKELYESARKFERDHYNDRRYCFNRYGTCEPDEKCTCHSQETEKPLAERD